MKLAVYNKRSASEFHVGLNFMQPTSVFSDHSDSNCYFKKYNSYSILHWYMLLVSCYLSTLHTFFLFTFITAQVLMHLSYIIGSQPWL